MWLIFAILTIISYAGLDFFIKKMSGRINDFVGIVIMSAVAIIPSLVVFLFFRYPDKKVLVSQDGIMYAALGGIALGIGTLAFLKLFDTGINLSLASPMVRIGILIATTSLGLFVLREVITPREWLGLLFAFIGLLLLVIKQ